MISFKITRKTKELTIKIANKYSFIQQKFKLLRKKAGSQDQKKKIDINDFFCVLIKAFQFKAPFFHS